MIVNTVPPEQTATPAIADPGADEFAVAGRIGPDETNHEATEAQREEYSAKVDLKLHLENGGSIVDLAQVGPDFAILPSGHGHIITAGTRGMLHVSVDGKCNPVEIELTTDVDFSTERFNYRKCSSVLSVPKDTTPVVTDTTAVVETEQAGLTKAEQERLFWEEVRLLGELRENESQRDQLNCELATAKERQRELQTELNNLSMRIPQIEEAVQECCEDTLTYARALWRLKAASDQSSQQPAAIEPLASEQPAALPAPVEESTEWRNLATAELLAGIKGLGKKKLETICELAPTVGHLEDLRGQASREHKQYNEVLPDGCGAGVAQMIEDRLVKHIADWARKQSAGNPLADELLVSFRQKVASEAWQPSDCTPDSNDTEQTHLGFGAFNEGKPHTALPTQNPELARQWMLGWVCAEVIKHAPPASESEASELAKQQQAETAPATEAKPPKKERKARSSTKKSK